MFSHISNYSAKSNFYNIYIHSGRDTMTGNMGTTRYEATKNLQCQIKHHHFQIMLQVWTLWHCTHLYNISVNVWEHGLEIFHGLVEVQLSGLALNSCHACYVCEDSRFSSICKSYRLPPYWAECLTKGFYCSQVGCCISLHWDCTNKLEFIYRVKFCVRIPDERQYKSFGFQLFGLFKISLIIYLH